jgi:hypothetical protein
MHMHGNHSLCSLWGIPWKSPSEISEIKFSCISSFLSMSNEDSADVGTDCSSLPPRFRRFSFLLNGKQPISDVKSAIPRHQIAPPPWPYSPNSGLGLPPWNFFFHFCLLDLRPSVGLLGRVISSSQGLYLYTNTENRTHIHKHQTSMPWVGFEPMIPASERVKTVHALDRLATVTGHQIAYFNINTRWILHRVYRMFQEERSVFWDFILILVILSIKVYTCPIPNGFRDRAISLYSTQYTVQTSNTPCPHTSSKVHWCWWWNFGKCIIPIKLYQLCHSTVNTGIRNST